MRYHELSIICWLTACFTAPLLTLTAAALATNYEAAIDRLERTIHNELDRGIIKGVTVALVDDQQVVHVAGYGWADVEGRVPAGPETVFRAGSISKLFNAMVVMHLVEQGRLDLDAPIEQFAPHFRTVVPWDDAKAITLRQLLCHRSGIIREAPVGNYFDPTEPDIRASVLSLADTPLVEPPDTRTRYSNIAPTVAGDVAATVAGASFQAYAREHLFEPMGMAHASFVLDERVQPNLATGYMRVADGQGGFTHQPSPLFDLATIPAGNLFATAGDLAKLAKLIFADGRMGDVQVLTPQSLQEMFTPQLTDGDAGFGLGFMVGSFAGHRSVGHNGAIYGFTSSFLALPQQKLAVIVLINEDIALGPLNHLTNTAMHLMLEAKTGQQPPAMPEPHQHDVATLRAMTGAFQSQSYWAKITLDDGQLHADISSQLMDLRSVGELRFEADGRFVHRSPVTFHRDERGEINRFDALGQTFTRVDPDAEHAIPPQWERFLGSYGPEFIPLIITARHGSLYAMTENMMDYRLQPLNQTVFNMPPGLFAHEQLVFHVGPDGDVHAITMANIPLQRNKQTPAE